jgi:hypothetical protein
MVRRLLHLIPLMLLLFWGPGRAMLQAGAPPALCCCGETDQPAQDLGPCGMPKCPPRCPQAPGNPPAPGLQTPAAAVSLVRAAQARKAVRRREPSPWPGHPASDLLRRVFAPAVPVHGPPLSPPGDPQARLAIFRI